MRSEPDLIGRTLDRVSNATLRGPVRAVGSRNGSGNSPCVSPLRDAGPRNVMLRLLAVLLRGQHLLPDFRVSPAGGVISLGHAPVWIGLEQVDDVRQHGIEIRAQR